MKLSKAIERIKMTLNSNGRIDHFMGIKVITSGGLTANDIHRMTNAIGDLYRKSINKHVRRLQRA